MIKYIDIHTHQAHESHICIQHMDAKNLRLDTQFNHPVSVGIHPWHLRDSVCAELLLSMDQVLADKNVLAVGECGLDRATSINFDKQLDCFLQQNELAVKHELPLIIHSVRSYSDFLSLLKAGHMKTPWVFHGYRGNYQIAKKLVDFGAFLSLGSSLMKNNSKTQEVLRKIPLQRLFIETDEDDIQVESLYKVGADILNLPLKEFAGNLYQNFIYTFNYGIK
jgi:TatD DNase family protein